MTFSRLEVTFSGEEVTSTELEVTFSRLEVSFSDEEVTSTELEVTFRNLEVTSSCIIMQDVYGEAFKKFA